MGLAGGLVRKEPLLYIKSCERTNFLYNKRNKMALRLRRLRAPQREGEIQGLA